MTLKEIAAKAGVSASTVSRIMNSPDDSFARKEVRDRVWQVIRETGYVPNQTARELKQGKKAGPKAAAGSLACVLGRTRNLDDDPFFAQLARVVEQHALESGYPVRLTHSIFDIQESETLRKIEAAGTDGAIVLGRFSEDAAVQLERYYKNLVYVGRNLIHTGWDQVICDGYEATLLALEYLVSSGHRRIGYIGETVGETRYQAYKDAVKKYGLTDDKRFVAASPPSGAGGYAGADSLLNAGVPLPSAVFCAADVAAIAALRRFTEAKVKVPEQLSLISMDNIEMSAYVSPMLTTVGMPVLEMGHTAVRVLISRIQKQHKLPLKIYLPNQLISRESVANIK